MNRREFLQRIGGLTLITVIGLATVHPAAARERGLRLAPASGPLRMHPENPRYFTNGSGKAVYLTGSHVWGNLQDYGYATAYRNPPPPFDYEAYLDMMEHYGHNFVRMWVWEAPHATSRRSVVDQYWARPMPYQRTGPGRANDGGLRFDLTKFNEEFFDQLRLRVIAAGERGIYVSVMLFQGWNVFKFQPTHESWLYHPLHRDNNINGLDGDPNGNGEGEEVHSLQMPEITQLQETYVRKVIDTVNDLDSVLFEISNETKPPGHPDNAGVNTRAWEYHMVRYIKRYEASKPKQHPVGVTSNSRWNSDVLDTSPSDWISLRRKDWRDRLYVEDLPPADGRKVSILDTDHLGAGDFIKDANFSRRWVWKAFTRGHNPILMDAFGIQDDLWDPNGDGFVAARWAMGHTRRYAERMNLAAMTPRNDLASSQYCLANPGKEYLIYLPDDKTVKVNLSDASGTLEVEWFNPRAGAVIPVGVAQGGSHSSFKAPFEGDALLYIAAKEGN